MAFVYHDYVMKMLDTYRQPGHPVYLDVTDFGIKVVCSSSSRYRCIGVHHLTAVENMSNHHVYLAVVDGQGRRLPGSVDYTWLGRRPDEPAPTIVLDKPDIETPGNIPMNSINQIIEVWVHGADSDHVMGLSTNHPDEGPWNTLGHHSFFVAWLDLTQAGIPVPPPVEPPVVPPAPPQPPSEPDPVEPPVVPPAPPQPPVEPPPGPEPPVAPLTEEVPVTLLPEIASRLFTISDNLEAVRGQILDVFNMACGRQVD